MRRLRIVAALVLFAGILLIDPGVSRAEDDLDPPNISVMSPSEGEDLDRSQDVFFDFSCQDEIDPEPTCTGTVNGPSAADFVVQPQDNTILEGAGSYTIEYRSEDASGNVTTFVQNFDMTHPTCDGQTVTAIVQFGEPATAGPDVILGSSHPDWIEGLGGADRICGGGLHDVIIGGPGADRIFGEAGNDVVFGEASNDRVDGGVGRDRLEGDDGTDTLLGGADADRLEGGSGNDTITGGPAADSCHGQEGTSDRQTGCEVRTGFP